MKENTVTKLLAPTNLSTTTTATPQVDLSTMINAGGRNLKAFLNVGVAAGTTVSIAAKMQDSDTTTAADFTDISGATWTTVTTTAGAAEAIMFRTVKRYVRIQITLDAGTTSAYVAASVVSGERMV